MAGQKPWYFTNDQWNDKLAQDARWATDGQAAGPAQSTPTTPTYGGSTAFDRRLTGVIDRADNEGEQQSGLLLVLVREIHTMKLILWWVLIIVPIIAIVLGIMLTMTAQPTIGQ
jgi:hypothetical protein